MTVLDALGREHRVFLDLIGRIERAGRFDDATADEEVRTTLLILLPALKRHEGFEDLIFGRESPKLHHRRIAELRERLQALLAWPNATAGEIGAWTFKLCERLKDHFNEEETRLWPRRRPAGRRGETVAARRAMARVRELERAVERSREMIAEYVGKH
jgi:hypothetical protein